MGLISTVKNAFEYARIKTLLSIVEKSNWSRAFEKGSPFFLKPGSVSNPYKQLSTIYKAVKAISDSALQAEYILKNYNTESEVYDREIENLLDNPNPLMTFSDFMQACAGFSALCDELFIIKDYGDFRDPKGKELPIHLWTFHPKSFQEVTEKKGDLSVLKGWKYTPTGHIFTPDQVIHNKGFNPDNPLRGLSPTDVLENEMDIAWNSLIFNKMFFKNSANPALSISTDQSLNKEAAERLKAMLDTEFKGSSNVLKTILLTHGLKIDPITRTHTDMEFSEQLKQTETAILGVFRVSKNMFGITDDLNYATSREQSRIFWEDTELPILKKILFGLNSGVIKPYNPQIYIEVDVSNIPAFKEVFNQKVDTALKMKTLGVPYNEINEKLQLGLKKQPWGDVPLIPFSEAPIDQVISGANRAQATPEIDEGADGKAFLQKAETKAVKAPNNSREIFLRIHTFLETKTEKKLSAFFYEQRKRVLSEYTKGLSNYQTKRLGEGVDWDEEDKELFKAMLPYITASVKAGANYAEQFGIQARNLDVLKMKISSLVAMQSNKISKINRTSKYLLTKRVNKIIEDSVKAGLSATETQEAIMRGVKDIYNMNAKRALMIARTETTNAMNGGSMAYYTEAGIQYKEWQSADDANVRESHKECEKQGPISIFAKFSNGLLFPGDPSGKADEVVNCRCSCAPVVEK